MKTLNQKFVIKYLTVIACLAFLAGCLAPEKFKATINIEKDGSYAVTFEGILTQPLVRMAILQGESEERVRDEMEKEAKNFSPEEGYRRFKYLEEGRFDVLFEKKGKANEPLNFPGDTDTILSIEQKGNRVHILVSRPDEKGIKMYKDLNMKIDGVLKVKTNGKVISQNAQSTPSLGGLIGAYTWDIKSPKDPPPEMVIEVSSPPMNKT